MALLRPHTVFSKPIAGRGPWNVEYEAYDKPSFSIVIEGQCWLEVVGEDPIRLERGDFLLCPNMPAFRLFSDSRALPTPVYPSETGVRHGETEGYPDFQMLGGTFDIERTNADLLFQLLPERIFIRSVEDDTSHLARVIDLIMEEYATGRPGREMILVRLLEVMLIKALRWGARGENAMLPGLLAGLRDPTISAALRAMHMQVRNGWTVADLARKAGMSRSAFAARFCGTMGCGPMEYLLRWRMNLAQDALSRNDASLEQVAQDIGYGSASAFSTAFRKRTGCAPGAYARLRRREGTCRDMAGASAT
jgi:AraC-like DNA-binding protein